MIRNVPPMLACLLFALLPLTAGCRDQQPDGAGGTTAAEAVPTAAPVVAATEPEPATDTRDLPPAAREPDVIYVPTPEPVVDAMLNLAEVKEGDVLYDLGSGDGRIPIAAARRFKVRGVGIDINPVRIKEARENAEKAGVTDLVTFKQADLFEEDFSEASVVTLYLLESLNEKLRPRLLAELKPGTRIVSHSFGMGDWTPEQTIQVDGRTIHRWTVPER
jgi:SAM-dependent methyltransferase